MMNSSVFLLFVLSWIINRRVLAAVLLNIAGEAFSRNPLYLTAFHLFAQPIRDGGTSTGPCEP